MFFHFRSFSFIFVHFLSFSFIFFVRCSKSDFFLGLNFVTISLDSSSVKNQFLVSISGGITPLGPLFLFFLLLFSTVFFLSFFLLFIFSIFSLFCSFLHFLIFSCFSFSFFIFSEEKICFFFLVFLSNIFAGVSIIV